MFAITYPHPKHYNPRAVLHRFGIASVMSLAVVEAASRHGVVLMHRFLRDKVKDESLRVGIKKRGKKCKKIRIISRLTSDLWIFPQRWVMYIVWKRSCHV